MRRALPLLALLVLGAAPHQGQLRNGGGPSSEVASLTTWSNSWAGNYRVFPGDGNTVSHMSWNGTALSDSAGFSWTMGGTVPQVASPGAFTTNYSTPKPGAGPFSATNRYTSSNANSALDFSGDFTACFAWYHIENGSYQCLFNDSDNGAAGLAACVNSTGVGGNSYLEVFQYSSGGQTSINTGGTGFSSPNSLNVGCFGRSGGTLFVQINNGAVKSGALVAPWTPSTGTTTKIGTRDDGALAFAGYIVEAWFTTTAWSTTGVATIMKNALRHTPETGAAIAYSRPVRKTDNIVSTSPTLTIYGDELPRLTDRGIGVSDTIINLLSADQTLNTWTTSNTSVTADNASSPLGWSTADTVATTASGGHLQSPNATAAATAKHTASIFLNAATPHDASIVLRNTTSNSDLCTATCAVTAAWPQANARCYCTSSAAVNATDTLAIRLFPGTASGTGTVRAWGAQIAAFEYLTPYAIQAYGNAYADSIKIPLGAVLDNTLASGSLTVTPEWGNTEPSSDKWIFTSSAFNTSSPGISLKYLHASDVWRFTAGGVSVDSAADAFSANTAINLSWRFSRGGNACISVDSVETCSGSVPAFSTDLMLVLGDANGNNNGYAVKDVSFRAGTTPTTAVAWIGDSITFGFGVTTPPPSKLQGQLSAVHVVGNYGTNGHLISNCQSTWTNHVKPALAATNAANKKLILLCSVNDLRAGTSAASIWTTYDAIITDALAAGVSVYPVTILPWKNDASWTAARQTETETLNTNIRNRASVTEIEAYSNMGGADPAALATAYDQGDGLHPNQTGADYLAGLVKAVISP